MKIILLFGLIILTSCSSAVIQQQQDVCISPDKLKNDVDYAYTKLKQIHPQLYQYISKRDLDYKMDSLKQTINKPLNPVQFYFKLQPVIAGIHEGHLSLQPPVNRPARDKNKFPGYKGRLFGYFGYYIHGNHLYITENKDPVYPVQPGSEILKINNVPVSQYIERYKKMISSDGFNSTFLSYYLRDTFFFFYTLENGFSDHAQLEISYKHKKKIYTIERGKTNEKDLLQGNETHKKTASANCITNRDLKFLTPDNSVAYMGIKRFSHYDSDKFYKEAFERIKEAKSSYLIIDIRNNYGGSLQEINNLYSYLVSEPFTLIKPSRIKSEFSPLKTNYFRKSSTWEYALKGITYPTFFFLKTLNTYKGKDGKSYYKIKADHITKPSKDAFHGKVYVLINGGSFSASSIFSSKLKFDRRAVLVGEESGGANDGTVAGFYSYQTLPNSKITLPIGILLVNPNITLSHSRRGVIPDIEIRETLKDIIHKNDVQLNWVKNQIEKEKKNTPE
ncbi:S41 family peptidase [Chryseobacterium populi]|uniref:Periplasmic protease n=1 Tax=Chryseobacterium populi TaxID=1144316 RepID=J2K5G3_9FLAO|nr:S41 family peptidase [Chryseobacterium populi]EJL75430.1 periplasmic protease [Chryseobacterium populi]